MRIGVSGSHGTGKSTLVEDLCARLPGYISVEEPYFLLEADGYTFAHPPSVVDYQAQLQRSLESLSAPNARVVFDRTPLDFLAYLAALGVSVDAATESPAIGAALASLDLLVIVPTTRETERALPTPEFRALQVAMNDALLDLVSDDPFNLCRDVPILELFVRLDARVAAVLAALRQ